ncbi:hypothetical protein L336_0211 [Candidatus Saccharimonas aalborgensis]|uniref:HD/PDEase domain-containing protein n=1 Tax=Candidatus Saccharimonas aalborgensis TaxID=1332188 RepID=R4PUT0_9BACT|nr:hypothetical protein [Candidatus Saccharimonas aalborgensis]MBP7775021.1 hypothetical protein [Candidatus Saccharimonas sp.]QQR51720.1 MAG: hypothetical protein IPF89_02810 [Candidatus Saccharibacteria bacterium]AGL61920.1 hypothetical protein L336_0211 [Candidatus Saccharimonas aalborgensis]QQS68451.1 MAG: hypothetical protein IPP24_00180 [Candidatus Saccharibacteria bacterium]QQS70742.1 MAG: hypothetical protein IPP92_00320 [Candidatus Saccharibacteria bacterium]
MISDKHRQMLDTVSQWHKGQFRGDVPVTIHCQNVANIVEYALTATGSVRDKGLLEDITLAALGHDLLEDTDIPRELLRDQYGERVLSFIELLTNHEDDYHTDKYMQQIASAPEEVRIIKYGDLIDNTTSVAYNLHQLGIEWGNDFFRPIMERTMTVLGSSEFLTHNKAASLLNSSVHLFANLLRSKLDQEISSKIKE